MTIQTGDLPDANPILYGSRAPATLLDVQPILDRSPESIWARVEQHRDDLFEALRRTSEQEGFQALVIKSGPFVQPAWVKLECWIPRNERGVTERGSAVVTIEAKEFHRYEVEYTVEMYDRGWSKTYRGLHEFNATHAYHLARFILGRGPRPEFSALQLREKRYQIWKPMNEVDVLSIDWLGMAPVALAILGLLMLLVSGFGLLFLAGAAIALYQLRRRRVVVRSSGKPEAEPRKLHIVDSWQAVVPRLGEDAGLLRERFMNALQDPPISGFSWHVENIWYWGLDGKVEREQIVLNLRRSMVFCQVYEYDQELYVGWDGF